MYLCLAGGKGPFRQVNLRDLASQKGPQVRKCMAQVLLPREKVKCPLKQLGYILSIIALLLVFPLCFLWRLITLLAGVLWSINLEGITLPDAILDLKCLIFYAERASGPDALARVIEAIGALSPDLQVDRNHPIIASFCETLFKFVIKPTSSVTEAYEYTSNLTIADFRQLLHALRFLYTSWLQSDHPYENKQVDLYLHDHGSLVVKELSKIFSQESQNISTVSLIADK